MRLRPEIIKLLEEHIGSKLLDIGLGDDFLDVTPKAKAKLKQAGLYETKKLLNSKESHQQNGKAAD